jgi:hypothetical protein
LLLRETSSGARSVPRACDQRNFFANVPIPPGMSTTRGHHRFTFGAFVLEWYDGGGYVESHLLWRLGRVPIAIALAGSA